MSPIALPIAELKPALAGLGKVIAKRCTLPVLGTLKLERTKDGWIALTGTDLDHHITVRLEQPGAGEPAALLVPYDELLKTCKACSNGEDILVERSGKDTASIRYAIGQQFVETKVESLPVEEFPEIPRFKGDAIALPDTVRASIHEAQQCASTDETRLILNGAYLDVSKPDASYVVGTDGRHLFSSNSFTLPLKNSLIIPAHKFIGWKEFNSDGEWQLKVAPAEKKDDSSYLQLSSRRWRFISRQIEGNYPNWRQVVPGQGSFATTIEFDPEDLPQSEPPHQGAAVRPDQGRDDRRDVAASLQRRRSSDDRHADAAESSAGADASITARRSGGRSPDRAGGREHANDSKASALGGTTRKETHARKQRHSRHRRGQKSNATTSPEKPALETALAQIEILRGDFRNAITGLNQLADRLKQAQRESKTSEKEIQSVRQTLRSLQSVRI